MYLLGPFICVLCELRQDQLLVCSEDGLPRSRVVSAGCHGAYLVVFLGETGAKSDTKRGVLQHSSWHLKWSCRFAIEGLKQTLSGQGLLVHSRQ